MDRANDDEAHGRRMNIDECALFRGDAALAKAQPLFEASGQRIGGYIGNADEPLRAGTQIGYERAGTPCGALGVDGVEQGGIERAKVDPDAAAAGEPGHKGGLVGDAEFEHPPAPRRNRLKRLLDDFALDAAARNRTEESAAGNR